jgi:hypothetical protein
MEKKLNPGNAWMDVLVGICRFRKTPTVREIMATVYTLKYHVLEDKDLSDLRYLTAFRAVFTQVINTDHLNADARHSLLQSIMADSPGRQSMVHNVKSQLVLIALGRKDGQGIPEALYWFNQMGEAKPYDWRNLLHGLVNHGQIAVACEMSRNVPPNVHPHHFPPVVQEYMEKVADQRRSLEPVAAPVPKKAVKKLEDTDNDTVTAEDEDLDLDEAAPTATALEDNAETAEDDDMEEQILLVEEEDAIRAQEDGELEVAGAESLMDDFETRMTQW